MKQAISLMLKINPQTHNISKKYKPHLTLVYSFEVSNQKQLKEHIQEAISDIKPFKLNLGGLKKSTKDYYLYLLVKKGKSEIIKLHKNLNSGILRNFKNPDMPRYIPHITLGIFKKEDEIDRAMKDSKFKKQRYFLKIDSIQLLTLNKDDSIKSIKNFKLK